MRTVLFTGSRGWSDVDSVIDTLSTQRLPFRGIVGDARGFDSIAWQVLSELGVPRLRYDAKWHLHGSAAGHIRNDIMLEMLLRCQNTIVIAGWDGTSPGTKSMIEKAEAHGVAVWKITYHPSLNK